MATPMNVGDVFRARVVTFQNSQLGLNIYYYRVVSLVGAPSYELFTPAYDTSIATQYKNALPANALYRGVGIARVLPTATLEFQNASNSGPGADVNTPAPLQMAGIITKQTAFPGKSNRGRVYVPFVPSDMVSATGEPTAGYQTFLTGIGTVALRPVVVTVGAASAAIFPVLFHKEKLGPIIAAPAILAAHVYLILSTGTTNFTLIGSPSSAPGTIFVATGPGLGTGTVREVFSINSTTDILSFRVNPKFASQHRRGDYGKLNSLPF